MQSTNGFSKSRHASRPGNAGRSVRRTAITAELAPPFNVILGAKTSATIADTETNDAEDTKKPALSSGLLRKLSNSNSGLCHSVLSLAQGSSKTFMVELSEADSKKWQPLLDHAALARAGVVEDRPEPVRTAEGDMRTLRQPKRALNPLEVDEMVQLYAQGKTVYELADLFGCHRQTVSRQLKSNGVRMRLTGMEPDWTDEARRLYESGMTLKSIGKRFGVSRNTIRTVLTGAGAQLRPRTTKADRLRLKHSTSR